MQQYLARVGGNKTGEQIKQRSLACAIRPENADDLALVQFHVEIFQHMQSAEVLVELFDLQQRTHDGRPRLRIFCQMGAMMPLGRKNKMKINSRL